MCLHKTLNLEVDSLFANLSDMDNGTH
eukprot:COSAG02_NODE_29069_length_576_cov_1.400419_1_plen_26_part_10